METFSPFNVYLRGGKEIVISLPVSRESLFFFSVGGWTRAPETSASYTRHFAHAALERKRDRYQERVVLLHAVYLH